MIIKCRILNVIKEITDAKLGVVNVNICMHVFVVTALLGESVTYSQKLILMCL